MTDKRRDIFNFNHSSKDLSQEQIVEIKEIYKYYHKKHRPFKKKSYILQNNGFVM